ncbi:MAG: hypothetical protein M0Z28_01530, partial [Rhodospirillales bacterium]|nr:hypothetical protein [Rhodospirillales bacterium]
MHRRRNQPRVQKTIGHKLAELEDHLLLLSQALDGLESGQIAHFRHLAAELRVLICESSGTDGLLWRLADELRVDDVVVLHQIGNVDPAHPLAQGLRFHFLPLCSPGHGDPRLPIEAYSLRDIIRAHEAIFGSGQGITHQRLIKWLCEQVGSGHEDEGIAPPLAELNSVLIGNAQAFFGVLQADAVLTA